MSKTSMTYHPCPKCGKVMYRRNDYRERWCRKCSYIKIADKRRGKKEKMSEEGRLKLLQSLHARTGTKHLSFRDEKNPMWKGDKAGYRSIHLWVRRRLGKPSECAFCGSEYMVQWASISHNAHRDTDDFIPLCVRCHVSYDKRGITP